MPLVIVAIDRGDVAVAFRGAKALGFDGFVQPLWEAL